MTEKFQPSRPERKFNVLQRLQMYGKRLEIEGMNSCLRLSMLVSPKWPEDEQVRHLLFDREYSNGLLEYAIISNTVLLHPNQKGTSVVKTVVPPYPVVAYDFFRPEEFGDQARQLQQGVLFCQVPFKILNRGSETYTYTGEYDNRDSFLPYLSLRFDRLGEMEQFGLIEATTYAEAYDKVGLYDAFKTVLRLNDYVNRTVYQVTPKGNSLILVISVSEVQFEVEKDQQIAGDLARYPV